MTKNKTQNARWQTKKLEDVCVVIAGQSPEGKFYNQSGRGLPFYQGKKEFAEKYLGAPTTWTTKITKEAQVSDILMSVRAPVGPINFATQKICIGRGLAVIRVKEELDKDFLFYFLGFKEKEICGNTGAVFASISKADIENIAIPLPPLPTQHRIVKILDEVFDKIAQAKTNTEKNLQNAKELFESYLQNIFANPGENWEKKRLWEVLQKTETINPTRKPNEEFIYLDVSSVNKDTKQIENVTVLLGKKAPSRARKLVKTNDVIFATVRPTHSRVALITKEYNNQVCSTGYFVLRTKDFLNNNLVYYFLLTQGFNKQMEKMQKGASYPAVNDSEVKNIFITFPKSISEQKSIVAKLDALSAETKKLEAIYRQKLAALEELKKAVLKKAFSGELS